MTAVPAPLRPRFQRLEQRLKDLGLYTGPIDADWGEGVDSGLDKLFAKAGWVKPPPIPPATISTVVIASKLRQHEPDYRWLADLELPKLVRAAIMELGVVEDPGSANDPRIMEWQATLSTERVEVSAATADAVPWCGLFTAHTALVAGYVGEIPKFPLWALNWSSFGVAAQQPCLGSICTFVRKGGGHVGFYVGEDRAGYYHILGGNQGDRVSIDRIAKSRLKSCREPAYKVRPASARPFIVAANGAVSTNER